MSNKNYNLLSIDAWAGQSEGEWEWNNWFKVGIVDIDINSSNENIIKHLINEGFLTSDSIAKVYAEDDQYNIVIKNSVTHEPIYAIEYGNTL